MTLASALLGCLIAAVEITLSPDQPLAYSYIDDPLIVEVRSDTACVADITITLDPVAGGDSITRAFPESPLGPAIDRWCAVKDLPRLRGPWSVTIDVASEVESVQKTATVFRVDRPAEAHTHPLVAYGSAFDRATLLALRGVAVNRIRVPATHPDIDALLVQAGELGMRVTIAFDVLEGAGSLAERLGAAHCTTIVRWELPLTGDAPAIEAAVENIQALPCSLPVGLAVDDEHATDALLASLAPGLLYHIVIHQRAGTPAVLEKVRDALAARGVEAPVLDYVYAPEAGDGDGDFLKMYFEALSSRAAQVAFPAAWVMNEGELQPGLSELNALAHGVPPAASYGGLARKGVRAPLFSRGTEWTLPLWARDGDTTLTLEWDEQHPVSLFDRWNNPVNLPQPEDGKLHLPVVAEVSLLQGTGGAIPREALLHATRSTVAGILEHEELAAAWPESAMETLADIEESPASDTSRIRFFTLLRAFPDIEERWHAGQLPRPVAVSALAHLAELSRLLCRLEAARGATFLEPLQDTLARCEEYQSLYLTGTTATPQARARGDWLVQEVRRLMDEVEYLLAEGSKIEADAVAALAEWRARGLEFAAKAGPLSDRTSLPEPDAEPEEKESTEKKGKKQE